MHCDLVQRPWDIGVGVTLPDVLRVDFFLLLLWHLWKARNAMIFYQLDLPPREVLNRVALDLDAWTRRYKKHRLELQVWRDWLAHVILPLPQLFPLNPLPCISFLVCRESIGLYKSFQLMVGGDPPDIARKKKSLNFSSVLLLFCPLNSPNICDCFFLVACSLTVFWNIYLCYC